MHIQRVYSTNHMVRSRKVIGGKHYCQDKINTINYVEYEVAYVMPIYKNN